MGNFSDLVGKIFRTKKIKFFNGLCPNRFGNVSYFSENGSIINNSNRNIYVNAYDENNNEILYHRIIDKYEYDALVENVKELKGFGMYIKNNSFSGMVSGGFVIMLDITYHINVDKILELLELNDDDFYAEPKNNELILEIMLKNLEIINNKKDWVIMERINPNKLFQEPEVKIINGKKMFYNNIASIEYFGLKFLKMHDKNQNLLFI